MVVLGVPVTLSLIEIKDAFLSYYSYRYFEMSLVFTKFKLRVVIRPTARSVYLMVY